MGNDMERARISLCAALLGSMSLMATASGAAGDISAMVDAADPAAGQAAFEICAACHAIRPDEPTLIGPTLWQVQGRDIASVEGFAYSPGLKAVEGSWDRAKLDAFLRKPSAFAKGTIMGFAGIADDTERAAVIAYLETFAPGATSTTAAPVTHDFGDDWPQGPGSELTGKVCSVCHSLAIVKQQGLSSERWDELLDWMVEEQGMNELTAEQRTEVIGYLSTHFGEP